jgi:hypothetical protein
MKKPRLRKRELKLTLSSAACSDEFLISMIRNPAINGFIDPSSFEDISNIDNDGGNLIAVAEPKLLLQINLPVS